MPAVIFRPQAHEELMEARAWYERQQDGLGQRFLSEVTACVQQIMGNPARFPKVRGEVRRALVRRFPYTIYFLLEPAEVVVLAVFHSKRNPKHLERR